MVRLLRRVADPEIDSYSVSDFAVVTLDNLNSYGKTELRRVDQTNKRRKVCILH